MIEAAIDLVLIVLVLAGSGFALIAAIGIWRLPDSLMRMHASSKAGTAGAACMFAAVAVHFGTLGEVTRSLLVVVFLALYGTWHLSRSRDFQLFGEIVPRVDTSEKVVALTFDDGPTPEYTDSVLDVLREKGVKATFFLMGVDAEKHPEQVRAIIADGHEIGNHTYNHSDMTLASVDKAKDEVERTDAAVTSLVAGGVDAVAHVDWVAFLVGLGAEASGERWGLGGRAGVGVSF